MHLHNIIEVHKRNIQMQSWVVGRRSVTPHAPASKNVGGSRQDSSSTAFDTSCAFALDGSQWNKCLWQIAVSCNCWFAPSSWGLCPSSNSFNHLGNNTGWRKGLSRIEESERKLLRDVASEPPGLVLAINTNPCEQPRLLLCWSSSWSRKTCHKYHWTHRPVKT